MIHCVSRKNHTQKKVEWLSDFINNYSAIQWQLQSSFPQIPSKALSIHTLVLTKMTKTIHINIVFLYYTIKLHFPNYKFGPHDLYTK